MTPYIRGGKDDLDFAFAHRGEICQPFTVRCADPDASYDGYEESEDTDANARGRRLAKKVTYP